MRKVGVHQSEARCLRTPIGRSAVLRDYAEQGSACVRPPNDYTMKRFKNGDRVTYQGKFYYVVEGPTMVSLGHIYSLSTVPPPIRGVVADDMELAPED
jgi:hypothetical protein